MFKRSRYLVHNIFSLSRPAAGELEESRIILFSPLCFFIFVSQNGNRLFEFSLLLLIIVLFLLYWCHVMSCHARLHCVVLAFWFTVSVAIVNMGYLYIPCGFHFLSPRTWLYVVYIKFYDYRWPIDLLFTWFPVYSVWLLQRFEIFSLGGGGRQRAVTDIFSVNFVLPVLFVCLLALAPSLFSMEIPFVDIFSFFFERKQREILRKGNI